MRIWFPQSVYKILPLCYFLIGLFFMVFVGGIAGYAIGLLIWGYVIYILWMRMLWKDTGRIS